MKNMRRTFKSVDYVHCKISFSIYIMHAVGGLAG